MGVSVLSSLPNTFLSRLTEGVNDIKSGNWHWVEVSSALIITETFHHKLSRIPLRDWEHTMIAIINGGMKINRFFNKTQYLIQCFAPHSPTKYESILYSCGTIYAGLTLLSANHSYYKPLYDQIKTIIEMTTTILEILVNPRQAIFELSWRAVLFAKSYQDHNPKIYYIFEHAIVLPLFMMHTTYLNSDKAIWHVIVTMRRIVPQNPGLQDRIKPLIYAINSEYLTRAALWTRLIRLDGAPPLSLADIQSSAAPAA